MSKNLQASQDPHPLPAMGPFREATEGAVVTSTPAARWWALCLGKCAWEQHLTLATGMWPTALCWPMGYTIPLHAILILFPTSHSLSMKITFTWENIFKNFFWENYVCQVLFRHSSNNSHPMKTFTTGQTQFQVQIESQHLWEMTLSYSPFHRWRNWASESFMFPWLKAELEFEVQHLDLWSVLSGTLLPKPL